MVHELKTWPQYFEAVSSGVKRFEIRKDDRGFKVGDTLRLLEFDPETKAYSGRSCEVCVTYLTDYEQANGRVVMSIEPANLGGRARAAGGRGRRRSAQGTRFD